MARRMFTEDVGWYNPTILGSDKQYNPVFPTWFEKSDPYESGPTTYDPNTVYDPENIFNPGRPGSITPSWISESTLIKDLNSMAMQTVDEAVNKANQIVSDLEGNLPPGITLTDLVNESMVVQDLMKQGKMSPEEATEHLNNFITPIADEDLLEDTTDTLEDVYEQPENIDVDIPVDNTPPVVEVEPDIPEPVITQPVEEEVKTEEEKEKESEAPSSTTTSPPSPPSGTTGSVTVTETVPQKPNILIIQLEEAIEKLGKNDPELKEKLEKEKEKLITESAEGLPIEESEIILDDETKLIYDPYEGWIEVGIVIPWENKSGEPVEPGTEPVVAKPVEKPVEESKNGEGKTEDGEGKTGDGEGKTGDGDGTGDGLGEKGLFANLGGKGAKDPLGKFQPVSIVDPVAPVSAADIYRRPQYITKSLFSEYFK
tara:strand:- start:161 stop:1444 length:1284 start_codon:yes stop_codon:yes gene_type:complete